MFCILHKLLEPYSLCVKFLCRTFHSTPPAPSPPASKPITSTVVVNLLLLQLFLLPPNTSTHKPPSDTQNQHHQLTHIEPNPAASAYMAAHQPQQPMGAAGAAQYSLPKYTPEELFVQKKQTEEIQKDVRHFVQLDTAAPFANLQDAVMRLLPFHVRTT